MSTPERHHTKLLAGPEPGDERGWFGFVLDLLPIPAALVQIHSGQVVVRNPDAAQLTLHTPGAGPAEAAPPDRFPPSLIAEAASEAGTFVTGRTRNREVRFHVRSRVIPPADGESRLALLSFTESPSPGATDRELREALALRDEFFSVATHELKDPLFSIQLSLQLLRHAAEKHGPVPVHVAHHLDVCGRQADRLSRIIDNLLDVSRIQSGRLQIDPEAIDLGALAREAVSRFQESARATGTELTARADEVIGYFDWLKLDQALSNLLTNALKYGAGRPVEVRVRESGESAILEVEDHGPGIAPADHARIFARFERASQGHKKDSLGLGLYIVRSIAEAHGGSIAVRSSPGQGATFTVTLPRNRIHKAGGPGVQGQG